MRRGAEVRFIGGRATAVRAVAALLGVGALEVRALASDLRQGAIAAYEVDDAVARMQMIAEVTHDFPLLLVRPRLLGRERGAREALVWRWGVSTDAAREWIEDALADAGPQFRRYPAMLEREHQRWMAKNPRGRVLQ
ncbi:hypothetical protein ACPPVO_27030 [Dactylosporangium sp. McL0621]|uniref:hypothetical protein n=1 Tax=Dactylosporangium sp. McL0621 TaxID=3415678 RepID=UPI003CED9517